MSCSVGAELKLMLSATLKICIHCTLLALSMLTEGPGLKQELWSQGDQTKMHTGYSLWQ